MHGAGEAFKNAGSAVVDGAKDAYNKTATYAQQHFEGTRREINTLEGVLKVMPNLVMLLTCRGTMQGCSMKSIHT